MYVVGYVLCMSETDFEMKSKEYSQSQGASYDPGRGAYMIDGGDGRVSSSHCGIASWGRRSQDSLGGSDGRAIPIHGDVLLDYSS